MFSGQGLQDYGCKSCKIIWTSILSSCLMQLVSNPKVITTVSSVCLQPRCLHNLIHVTWVQLPRVSNTLFSIFVMIACTALQAHFSFSCSATVCLLRVATPHTTIQQIHNSHRPYLLKRLGYRNRFIFIGNKIFACIKALQGFQYEFTYPSNFILKKVVGQRTLGNGFNEKCGNSSLPLQQETAYTISQILQLLCQILAVILMPISIFHIPIFWLHPEAEGAILHISSYCHGKM